MINYENYVKPFSSNFIHIEISEKEAEKIESHVTELIKRKANEIHHLNDNKSHFKRYYTGTLGEFALEKFLGIDGIVDWTIGNSADYHSPDLKKLGLNVGIKTVEYGLFPIIFKINYSSEIIMIRWKERHVYICGLATKDVLNKHQTTDLIMDKKILTRGSKTAFYGFQHLKKFNDIKSLKSLLNQF